MTPHCTQPHRHKHSHTHTHTPLIFSHMLMKYSMMNCPNSDQLGKSLHSETMRGGEKKRKTSLTSTGRSETKHRSLSHFFSNNLSCSLNQTRSDSNNSQVLPYANEPAFFFFSFFLGQAHFSTHTRNVNISSQLCLCNLSKWYDKNNYGGRESFEVIADETRRRLLSEHRNPNGN